MVVLAFRDNSEQTDDSDSFGEVLEISMCLARCDWLGILTVFWPFHLR